MTITSSKYTTETNFERFQQHWKVHITLKLVYLLVAISSFVVVPCHSLQLNHAGVVGLKQRSANPIAGSSGAPTIVLDYYKKTKQNEKVYNSLNAISGGGGGENVSSSMAVKNFVQKNSFLLGMAVAVSFAKTFPSLGKSGGVLRPELFIGKFGVMFIFLISGLSLELSELTEAFGNMKLNVLTQLTSFLAWPLLVGLPLVHFFKNVCPNLLTPALADGLLVLTCLPTTVNMCILITSSAGGNVATALCNAVIGNILGIFVTPALLLRYFGTSIALPFVDMVFKLCNKVLLPVMIGQLLRFTKMKEIYLNNKKKFKTLQELLLTGIVWNAFCNAFTKGLGLDVTQTMILLVLLPALHLTSLAVILKVFSSKFLNFTREQTVAATLCASHKTLAFGLPLINTVFENNPNLAAYCAPIMIIHPTQLVLGSLLVPKFANYIQQNKTNKEE